MEIDQEIIWRLAGHSLGQEVSCRTNLKVPGDDDRSISTIAAACTLFARDIADPINCALPS